jgi:hypothetical protein
VARNQLATAPPILGGRLPDDGGHFMPRIHEPDRAFRSRSSLATRADRLAHSDAQRNPSDELAAADHAVRVNVLALISFDP